MSNTKNSTYFDSLEYEADRLAAQDYDAEVAACRRYLLETPKASQSFEGWREYWEVRRLVPGCPGYYVTEEFFDELRSRNGGRKAVKKEKAKKHEAEVIRKERAAFLERLNTSGWLASCEQVEGTEPPFIWKGKQTELVRELLENQLVPAIPNRWQVTHRVFELYKTGERLTAEQLRGAAKKII